MAAVAVSAVRKSFGATVVLDVESLRVEEGTVHGLLGPNGAGKSTLLRMIFGLVRPDRGTITVFGGSAGSRGLCRVGGFVEAPAFYPYLSGRRNLALLAAYDGGDARGRIEPALATVGLTARAGDKVVRYSLGMRQRLGIAAALLRDPRLLVLDEPANGLDPAGARALRELIRGLAGAGRTVLLSSHQMSEVEALCDRVTVLRAGRVAYEGSPADLRGRAPAAACRLWTSDDVTAARLAGDDVTVRARPGGGLTVRAGADELDRYVIGLGRDGIAVRRLEPELSPLEALLDDPVAA